MEIEYDSSPVQVLRAGVVIPAHPLALTDARQLDERRQRALTRYYLDSGAGGLAVAVHTTQFGIHDPKTGLLQPVLAMAAEEMDRAESGRPKPIVRIAGICGDTPQAVREAHLARDLGYQFGLISPSSFTERPVVDLLDHYRAIADVLSVIGFYLQPSVGGLHLPADFWHGVCEIDNVVGIKVAAFDRYRTIDVVRAVCESGRDDIALYTGNDDNIVCDLVTPYHFQVGQRYVTRRFVGGLLGQWATWTSRAVELLNECQRSAPENVSTDLLKIGVQLTDANAAIFDVRNNFHGCIPGIHEILRRQGLLVNRVCLDRDEVLSPGQLADIDRVVSGYVHLQDNEFIARNLDRWLDG